MRDPPIMDAAVQATGMTMADAVQVSYIGVQFMNTTLLTLFIVIYIMLYHIHSCCMGRFQICVIYHVI